MFQFATCTSSSGAGKCNRRRIDSESRPSLKSAALLEGLKGVGVAFAKERGEREARAVVRYLYEEGPTLGDRVMLESLLPVRECPRDTCTYFHFIGSVNWLKKLLIVFVVAQFARGLIS